MRMSIFLKICAGAFILSSLIVIQFGYHRASELLVNSPQKLYYTDRGMTVDEITAVQKSKALSHRVASDEDKVPTLVDKFMSALRDERGQLEAFYDYSLAPKLAYGLKPKGRASAEQVQQLAVIMKTCVSCVSECPAYVKKPFQASSFDEFQSAAMSACPQCFHAVAGPCPANQDNHGVLRPASRAVSLAAHPAAPALAAAGTPQARHAAVAAAAAYRQGKLDDYQRHRAATRAAVATAAAPTRRTQSKAADLPAAVIATARPATAAVPAKEEAEIPWAREMGTNVAFTGDYYSSDRADDDLTH